MSAECKQCHAQFTRSFENRRYCSDECRRAHERARHAANYRRAKMRAKVTYFTVGGA